MLIPTFRHVDFGNLSSRALQKIVSAQAIRIEHQRGELKSLNAIIDRDAAKTSIAAAAKFFVKCLITRDNYAK